MPFRGLKRFLVGLSIVVILGIGAIVFAFLHEGPTAPTIVPPVVTEQTGPIKEIIGTSVEGRDIAAYTYGTGKTKLLFVGGMHGGYEWNSVLLAYKFMDYLAQHPDFIPSTLKITVVPSVNPDGVYAVVGREGRFTTSDVSASTTVLASGRFNAHKVDLNRNFDCNWQATSTWQSRAVSAGTAAFSEPEAQAIRNFVVKNNPAAVVFWHSQANAVYASECEEGILPGTLDVMNAYAHASGYPAVKSFDAYAITGDSEGWLASIHIPAITVELQTHETVEWERNLAGIKALFDYYNAQ